MSQFTPESLLTQLKSGVDVLTVFRGACGVEDSGILEPGDDRDFITIYQKCQHHGLSYNLSPHEFLDSCLRLSTLLFRYGRAHEAENYLLFLANVPERSGLPAWVWSYSAKLEYLRNIRLCTQQPSLVLDWLEISLISEPGNRQALAVFSDFVMEATNFLKASRDDDATKRLKTAIDDFSDSFIVEDDDATRTFVNNLFTEPGMLALLDDSASKQKQSQAWMQVDISSHLKQDEPNLAEPVTESLAWKITGLELKLEQIEEEHLELQLKLVEREQELCEVKRLLAEKDDQTDTVLTSTAAILSSPDIAGKGHRSTTLRQETPQPHGEETPIADGYVIPRQCHILVVGDARTHENHLLGICKSFGIEPHQVKFKLDFNAFDKIDIKSLAYDSKIAGILIGPLPHKVPGCDDPANVLMTGDGFPPSLKVETNSGELKITKAAFRTTLKALLIRISSGYHDS